MKSKIKIYFLGMFFLISGVSCHERGPDPSLFRFFDQKGFVENIGKNLIIPSYKDLTEKSMALDTALTRLVEQPGKNNLLVARQSLKDAWLSWQYCLPFEFGPSELRGLKADLNSFPANTTQIEANLKSTSIDLNLPENSHAKGFATLDYLLNNKSITDEKLLATIEKKTALNGYMLGVADQISLSSNLVYRSWDPAIGGVYYVFFTDDDALGVKEGSSVSDLVNGLAKSLELAVTKAKVGIPIGDYSGGLAAPEATEGHYGGYSLELLKASIEAYQLIFTGTSRSGVDGLGFDEYLNIKGARLSGTDQQLSEALASGMDSVLTTLQLMTDPLSDQIVNNLPAVQELNNQLKALSYLLKEEMAPALRVEITY
ncbi:imelysin family protein [uncultured Imperialibacter sp.]|uniref:imelysin family protein n=1 Tax=uncultured Imperialibacter sp. TaxID=1672639 RepID=UPI0030DCFC20|tara:strand:- start:94145 stop:95260 length:1116 start_codon:yes stop_codon:yes gene_type:complete